MNSCKHRIYVTAILAALAGQFISQSSALAQASNPDATKTGSAPPPTDTPAPAKQNFGGLSLGVGLGLTLNLDKVSRVTSASPVNGIVRVTGMGDAVAGIVLESHYFFVPNYSLATVPQGAWGHGPFVAIVAGSSGSNVISAYALGWMMDYANRPGPTPTTPGRPRTDHLAGISGLAFVSIHQCRFWEMASSPTYRCLQARLLSVSKTCPAMG